MNKISIRAVPKLFKNGSFLLLPATPNDKRTLDMFCNNLPQNDYVRVVLSETKANKSYDQVRTIWALISIIYEIDNHSKPTAEQAALYYTHFINLYAPMQDDPLDPTKKIPVTLSKMTKYEATVFVNCLMKEAMQRMGISPDKSLIVDVEELFTEFIEWRNKQKIDPIDVDENGNWLSIDEWCERNPASMASGSTEELEVCHIITKSKRPDLRECVWNLLRMTHYEHIEIQHRFGWERLLSIYPHLTARVKAAYDRAGELYPFNSKDTFEESASLAEQALEEEKQMEIF